jgi:hypothetical protein
MRVDTHSGMAEQTTPTVEQSLAALSEAVGRASDDLTAVRSTLDLARTDIATRNTSVTRDVIKEAERVIDHLRRADQGLRDVLRELAARD